jgi:hypothetical protein
MVLFLYMNKESQDIKMTELHLAILGGRSYLNDIDTLLNEKYYYNINTKCNIGDIGDVLPIEIAVLCGDVETTNKLLCLGSKIPDDKKLNQLLHYGHDQLIELMRKIFVHNEEMLTPSDNDNMIYIYNLNKTYFDLVATVYNKETLHENRQEIEKIIANANIKNLTKKEGTKINIFEVDLFEKNGNKNELTERKIATDIYDKYELYNNKNTKPKNGEITTTRNKESCCILM